MEKLKSKNLTWEYTKSMLLSLFRTKAIKAVLAKAATYTILGPVKAWLLTFITEYLFDHIIIPLLKELELEGKYRIDQVNGKKRIKLLNEAIENEDINAINDYIDSL